MTSYKGGSGRSTAAANVAYQLAVQGYDVCLVDLDLASPTLGAILGMEGYETGAEQGVHHLLPRTGGLEPVYGIANAPAMVLDVTAYCQSDEVPLNATGKFEVLLGSRDFEDVLDSFAQVDDPLDKLLVMLGEERYDAVFVDVRSGSDSPLDALATGPTFKRWVVFHRWTPQHLEGTYRLLKQDLGPLGQGDVLLVRTAYQDPGPYRGATLDFVREQERELSGMYARLFERDIAVDPPVTIPREELLFWREGILNTMDYGPDCETTVQAYRALASRLMADGG